MGRKKDGKMKLPAGWIFIPRMKNRFTIEVEQKELVTCNDCIHCADDWNGNQPMFTCELGRCGESVHPDDFCSYTERREDT